MMNVAQEIIKQKTDSLRGEFEDPHLSECLEYVEQTICNGWLRRIIPLNVNPLDIASEEGFDHWCDDLRMFARREFCSMR